MISHTASLSDSHSPNLTLFWKHEVTKSIATVLPPGWNVRPSQSYPKQYVAGTQVIHLDEERQCGANQPSLEPPT